MSSVGSSSLRVGVIGAGRMGKLRSEILAHRVHSAACVAITDANLQAADAIAEKCGFLRVAKDSSELLDSSDIDAVIICSSTDPHAELIKGAPASGKHIFCEKPIHHSLVEIDEAWLRLSEPASSCRSDSIAASTPALPGCAKR